MPRTRRPRTPRGPLPEGASGAPVATATAEFDDLEPLESADEAFTPPFNGANGAAATNGRAERRGYPFERREREREVPRGAALSELESKTLTELRELAKNLDITGITTL